MSKASGNVVDQLIMWWALEKCGTVTSLAKALNVQPATIYYWRREGEGKISPKFLRAVERITDGVFTVKRLRPDLFV